MAGRKVMLEITGGRYVLMGGSLSPTTDGWNLRGRKKDQDKPCNMVELLFSESYKSQNCIVIFGQTALHLDVTM